MDLEELEIYNYSVDNKIVLFKICPNNLRDWEFKTAVDPQPLEKVIEDVRNYNERIIKVLQNFPQKKDGTFCKNRYIVVDKTFVTHKVKYGFPIGREQLIRITYDYEWESFRINICWGEPEYFKNKGKWWK